MWFDTDQSSNRILVIDDNLDIHEDFRVILGPQGQPEAPLDDLESDLFGSHGTETAGATGSRWREYDLAFAAQGQEGFEMVRDAHQAGAPFALAFVDMRMPPGWNGLETIEKLWQVDPDLQVVICTAYSDFSQLEIMKRLGRSDNLLILKKPFDPEEIAQITVTMLQKREMTRRAALNLEQMERLVAERTEAMARSQFHEGRTRKAMDNLIQGLDGEENRFVRTERLANLGLMLKSFATRKDNPVRSVRRELPLLEGYLRTLDRNLQAFQRLVDDLHAGKPPATVLAEAEAVTHRADLANTLGDFEQALKGLLDRSDAMVRDLDNLREFAATDGTVAEFTDLNEALGVVLDLADSFLAGEVHLERRLDEIPPLACVRSQMLQVLAALVINAIQAAAEGGRVSVRTWLEDDTACVAVEDDGCGIDADNLQRVFDPYFTTKGSHWGTGLGLGVAREVARQHGGRIAVESQPGQGTVFTLSIPLKANEPGRNPGEQGVEDLLTRVPAS